MYVLIEARTYTYADGDDHDLVRRIFGFSTGIFHQNTQEQGN